MRVAAAEEEEEIVRSPVGGLGPIEREALAGTRCTTPLSLVDLRRSSARPARRADTRRPPVVQSREKKEKPTPEKGKERGRRD